MKKTLFGLAFLIMLVGSALANPIGFDFATFDVNGEVLYTIMYNGSPVPQGSLLQVIRPNGTLHAPSEAAGDLGAVSGGDIINSQWQIGEGTGADGLFALFLTGQSSAPNNTQNATSLNAGTNFYVRIWADVSLGASAPFASGSHYVDGGPYIVPTADGSLWDVQVNPTSASPTWLTCGSAVLPAAISVTEVGGGAISAPLDFGSSIMGTPVTHTIRISNTGGSDLTLAGGAITGDFSYSALTSPVAAGGHLDVTLTFNPSATGARVGVFGFTHNAAGSPYSLSLTGTGLPVPAPVLAVTEVGGGAISTPLDFGSSVIGTPVTHTIRISNTGTADLTLGTGSITGDFSHAALTTPIAAGGHIDVVLTFNPTDLGVRPGLFGFTHNAGVAYSLALTGTGLPVPTPGIAVRIGLVPVGALVLFGADTIGGASDRIFTVENTGSAELVLNTFATTGDFAFVTAPADPLPVAAGGNIQFTVRFTPTVAGTRNGTLTFQHNATGSPFSVNLEGTGTTVNRWADGGNNTGDNPHPGDNGNPWNPSFPPDPGTNNLPPVLLAFSGNVGVQPVQVVVNYVTDYPTELPVGGFTGPGIFNPMPYNPLENIQRWWNINQLGGSSFRARVELYFTDNDLPVGFGDPRTHTPRLMALAYHLGVWQYYYPVIDLYAAGSPNVWRATMYNVQQFSTWTLTAQPVTPVTALTMDASAGDRQVTLHWSVATEVNNWGFEIERKLADDPTSNWTLVHQELSKADGGNSAVPLNYYYVDSYNLENGRTYSYRITDKALDGSVTSNTSRTVTPHAAVVNEYSLSNYPNPFNPTTRIAYSMVSEGNVKITVTNIMGQTIATLVNGSAKRGTHYVNWNASDMPSGIYFLRMETTGFNTMRKMVLSK